MQRLLILGANGFIGKNLKDFFNNSTKYQVLAPSRHELNLLDDSACCAYLKNHLPDFIIHCAVDITSVEKTLTMFFNIYNHYAYFGQLINIGSGAEYDKRFYRPRMTEEQFGLSVPTDTYGLAKYLIGRQIEAGRNKQVTNLRVFGIFGPYEDINRRFISNNVCRVLCGLPISLNRDMLFDYMHVDDLAKVIDVVLPTLPLKSPSYNLCSGRPHTLLDIARVIQQKLAVKSEIIIKNMGNNPEYSGDPRKFFNEVALIEFEPITSSIDKLIRYYQKILKQDDLIMLKRTWLET
jgi:UDP-glucose 4-epimerase